MRRLLLPLAIAASLWSLVASRAGAQPAAYSVLLTADRTVVSEDDPTVLLTVWCAVNGPTKDNFGPSNLIADVVANMSSSIGYFTGADANNAVAPFSNGPRPEVVNNEGSSISISGIDVFRSLNVAYPAPPQPGPPPHGANELVRAYTFRLTVTDFTPRTAIVVATARGGRLSGWHFSESFGAWVPSAGPLLGNSSSSELTIDIGGPPRVLRDPSGGVVPQGSTALISATGTGSTPMTWQWRHNEQPLVDGARVSGATTRSLAIGSFGPSDVGVYDAVLTNAHGTTITSGATLIMGQADSGCREWATDFGGPDFAPGSVKCSLVYDDGSGEEGPTLFVGGSFRQAGATESAGIAKWDGRAWESVGGGVNTEGDAVGVFAMVTHDEDGPGPGAMQLYAAGLFDRVGGQNCSSIARWDGHTWTPLGEGFNGSVRALAVFDEDGPGPQPPLLFAAGSMTMSGQAPIPGIGRWDGSTWSAVGGGLTGGAGANFPVAALAVFDGGAGPALYAAGGFDFADGNQVENIARWDGKQWSDVGGGIGSGVAQVNVLAVHNDGAGARLYAAGLFNRAGSVPVANIARWDGAAWESVGGGIPPAAGASPEVMTLRVFDDGVQTRLYAGGGFDPSHGSPFRHLVSWDGAQWAEVGGGANADVTALGVFDRGNGPSLYVFGVFNTVGAAVNSPGMAEWTGSQWVSRGNAISMIGGGGFVSSLASFDEGAGPALFAGGSFRLAGAARARSIARWDGGSWSSLGPEDSGPNGPVYTMTAGPEAPGLNALYVGGSIGNITGEQAIRVAGIAAWNGSSWSDLDGGFHGIRRGAPEVFATLYVPEGASGGPASGLYAAGGIEGAGGEPSTNIAWWNGSAWESFPTGTDAEIVATVEFDDGSGPAAYAAGSFRNAGGAPASYIAKWNGVEWTPLASGTNGRVLALAVYADKDGPALYAGGQFTMAGEVTARGIARWDGTAWSAVRANPDDGQNPQIYSLRVIDTGNGPELYAGGSIWQIDGVAADAVAKWNGVEWSRVGDPLPCCAYALEVFDDGSGSALYIALGGSDDRVAKLVGNTWQTVGSFEADVHALAVYDDGNGAALYAGGSFEWAYEDGAIFRVAKMTPDGWVPVGSGIPAGPDATTYVYALKVYDDGSGAALYAAGNFDRAGGVAAHCVARWDGEAWSPVGAGGISGSRNVTAVRSLSTFHDGVASRLCAAGSFRVLNPVPINRIARWNGGEWEALSTGLHGGDWAFAVALFDEDGDGPNPASLFVGGNFTHAGDIATPMIARWDGAAWSSVGGGVSTVGPGYFGVRSMAVFDDGSGPALYIGGDFTHAGGVPAASIAKWDGSSWSSVGGGMARPDGVLPLVAALAVHDNGSGPALYATGSFLRAGNTAVGHLARWDGAAWAEVDGGLDADGQVILGEDPFGGGNLYVGGDFSRAGPVLASRIASLGPCPPRAELPPCLADWDVSGVVNSNDFFTFLADFFELRADFDADGQTSSQDFFDFLAAFFTGC